MGSFFTSIGKILSLKFMLILVSIILLLELYFISALNSSLTDDCIKYLTFESEAKETDKLSV